MLRLLSIATLLLIVGCIVIGASIALADASSASATATWAGDARGVDVYEFDFPVRPETMPHPEFGEITAYQDI